MTVFTIYIKYLNEFMQNKIIQYLIAYNLKFVIMTLPEDELVIRLYFKQKVDGLLLVFLSTYHIYTSMQTINSDEVFNTDILNEGK